MAMKINKLSEGLNDGPIVLTENADLFEQGYSADQAGPTTSSLTKLQMQGPKGAPMLSDTIIQCINLQQEDDIIQLLKQSSYEEISAVTPDAWQQLLPVLAAWSKIEGSEKEVVSFSLAYHILQHSPMAMSRPSSRAYTNRLAESCKDLLRAKRDLQSHGGLSFSEMTELHRALVRM